MAELHLIEPYRSAVIAKAFEAGLVQRTLHGTEDRSSTLRIGQNHHVAQTTMQLLVLFDDVSLMWSEYSPLVSEQSIWVPGFSADGLRKWGLVQLVAPLAPLGEMEDTKHPTADFWNQHAGDISDFEPIVLSQMQARGEQVDYVLYRLIRALRLGDVSALRVILSCMPRHLASEAQSILDDEPEVVLRYDLPILGALSEARTMAALVRTTGCGVAGAPLACPTAVPSLPDAVNGMMVLILEELLDEGIDFPVPQSLQEIEALRCRQEVRDFRNTFLPWIDAICEGNANSVIRLRGEVRKSARAFKRYPLLKTLASVTAYASVGMGAIEAITGSLGLSIGSGIIAIGCEALARRLQKKSSWIMIAQKQS